MLRKVTNSLEEEVCNHLAQLFNSTIYADITIRVGLHDFKAHTAILAALSPVFRAMFKQQFLNIEDNKENVVEIKEIDFETMNETLRFIYTGKVPELHKMAFELLSAADKFDLETLKNVAENSIFSNMSIENVYEILVIADCHSVRGLKSYAIDFINSNTKEVRKTSGYKNMSEAYHHLVDELYANKLSPPHKKKRT